MGPFMGLRVDVVDGGVERAGQLFGVEQLVGPGGGVVEEMYNASGGALGDGLNSSPHVPLGVRDPSQATGMSTR
jgi:hypothetical protein